MSEAVRLLHALSQALAAMSLYSPGHPATRRSAESVWQAVAALLAVDEHPVFLFLGVTPVYAGRTLHELRDWPWSARLAGVGVQRLEFDRGVTEDSIGIALARILVRLTASVAPPADEAALDGVRFGPVTVEDALPEDDADAAPVEQGGGEVHVELTEELDAMAYVLSEAARGIVARAEAEAIVRILGGILDQHALPQAVHGVDHGYAEVHAVNSAMLAMVAGSSWLDRSGRQRIGVVALMHDIGMARLPRELAEGESLSAEQRVRMETHTMDGARLLLEGGAGGLELAAVVAFEHHLRPDGTGYPTRRFPSQAHWASRLVGTCATYDALRAPRPYRPPWSLEQTARFVEQGAGTVFDTEAARLLLAVVTPS